MYTSHPTCLTYFPLISHQKSGWLSCNNRMVYDGNLMRSVNKTPTCASHRDKCSNLSLTIHSCPVPQFFWNECAVTSLYAEETKKHFHLTHWLIKYAFTFFHISLL